MLLTFTYLTVGLCLLYIGAEGLVRGSSTLALRLGLTRLFIGLIVVAYGTSSPELVVSIKASLDGNGAISLGNVIGSNICNIALILGLSALLSPLRVHVQVVRLQIPIMIVASLVLCLLLLDGQLNRFEGLGLFCGSVAYTMYSIYLARKETNESFNKELRDTVRIPTRKPWVDFVFVLAGFAMLVLGANLFVSGAVSMAKNLGVSQALIGLTLVALGTSLPELATSLVSAVRKEGDIAVGNVVGSNIFNILAILGIASLICPIESGGISVVDLIVMVVIGAFALPMMWSGFLLNRWEGAFLLAIYCGYIYYLLL